jgi:hypothetical protein
MLVLKISRSILFKLSYNQVNIVVFRHDIMKRISLLLISSIVLLNLASCGESKETAPKAEAPVTTEKMAKPTVKPAAAGFSALQAVVTKTQGAIEKGDFAAAKTDFAKFETSWKIVEDGVKAKAPKLYGAIEDEMDAVGNGIKSKDKAKTLAALKALTTSVASAAK